jgi:very-short-patch-repair endonuclease
MQQDPQLKSRAREMRREPTPAEQRLWQAVRNDQLGARFARST